MVSSSTETAANGNSFSNSIRSSNEKVKEKLSSRSRTVDSEGNQLSEQHQEYFRDSKVRDKNGNLRVMYRGGNEDFTVFDRKKSKYANLYSRGFYFTDSESHARQYGNAKPFYLNITNPIMPGQKNITKDQLRKFLQEVAENEDYGLDNYGYGATVASVLNSVYGKGDFEMLMDINQTAIGDMVAAVELFNEVNGTNYVWQTQVLISCEVRIFS